MTINPLSQAERMAAAQTGARYLNPYPWFCTTTCAPVIDHYLVYRDQLHITATFRGICGERARPGIGLFKQHVELSSGPAIGVPRDYRSQFTER